MKAIDRLTSHYGGLPRRSIAVPEMSASGEEPFRVWWSPWTIEEKKELFKAAAGDDRGMFARILIAKAEDEEGNKLFDRGDLPKLSLAAHEKVVARIAAAILDDSDSFVSLEDAKGN